MAILTASAANEGAVLGFGGLLPVISKVTATTMASERSHPKMKAAPFLVPPFASRIRMNAVSGMGSRVIASPMMIRSMTMRVGSLSSDPNRCAEGDGESRGRCVSIQRHAWGTVSLGENLTFWRLHSAPVSHPEPSSASSPDRRPTTSCLRPAGPRVEGLLYLGTLPAPSAAGPPWSLPVRW